MDNYYSEKQESKEERKQITVTLRGNRLKFITASGIFSKDHIDDGSFLLIEQSLISKEKDRTILDLGCGYGAVGIAISRAFPESQVLMSDINERAVQISQENARLNKSNAKAVKSDVFENLHRAFDCILLNPPQSAGKNLCFRMIEESFEHLNAGGSFQLVARHQKGGRTLSEKMHEVFGNCKAIAKSKGFRIYYSEKERE